MLLLSSEVVVTAIQSDLLLLISLHAGVDTVDLLLRCLERSKVTVRTPPKKDQFSLN